MTAGRANPGRECADAGRLASRPSEWSPAGPREDEGLGLQGSPDSHTGALAALFLISAAPPHPPPPRQKKKISAERFVLFPSFCAFCVATGCKLMMVRRYQAVGSG